MLKKLAETTQLVCVRATLCARRVGIQHCAPNHCSALLNNSFIQI